MLTNLHIQNLALIQDTTLSLQKGFHAITGESGAGKSIILAGLKLCAGGRANVQMIRQGTNKAQVEATFHITQAEIQEKLDDMGIDLEDGELIIQREILANGKSRARMNGSLVSQTDLSALGDLLIQFHGQSEQVLLRDIKSHIRMLDAMGSLQSELKDYRLRWKDWQTAIQAHQDAMNQARELAAQKEFLAFQYEELKKANLRQGEEEKLKEQLDQADNAQDSQEWTARALDLLEGDGNIQGHLAELERLIPSLEKQFPQLQDILQQARESHIVLNELTRELQNLPTQEALAPQEIERINARLALLQRLQRKYHCDCTALIELRNQRQQELETLENLDDHLEDLRVAMAEQEKKVRQQAQIISEKRKSAAQKMDQAITTHLQQLGMPAAIFKTLIEPADPGPLGTDQVEFLIAPNKGEGMRPLRKAVSGGELSRILLAFKLVLAGRDAIPVLIFDEVDAGMSGEVAHQIGECLRSLGQYHQVLSITHLHQVASSAHHQIHVYKEEQDERTLTHASFLEPNDRVQEIARMLGDPHSDESQKHAQKILKERYAQ